MVYLDIWADLLSEPFTPGSREAVRTGKEGDLFENKRTGIYTCSVIQSLVYLLRERVFLLAMKKWTGLIYRSSATIRCSKSDNSIPSGPNLISW